MIGQTLSFYLADRFARSIFAAFMLVFVLIYAVDLVELLRRSGNCSAPPEFSWPVCRFFERRQSLSRLCHSRFCSVR